jgi:phosphoribosylanthranilate isomerase
LVIENQRRDSFSTGAPNTRTLFARAGVVWIKICATTCIEDALASIEAGANAVGFVFAPSKRQVSAQQVQTITAQLPFNIERIGVFSDDDPSRVAEIADQAGLTGIQLHGQELPQFVHHVLKKSRTGQKLRVIKTVLVNGNFVDRLARVNRDYDAVDSILLDSGAGSGKTFDWESVQPVLSGLTKRLIIAGGLTPENVGGAIAKFSPYGVDVVSGVEREPGRKDPAKLKAFVAAVRKANS